MPLPVASPLPWRRAPVFADVPQCTTTFQLQNTAYFPKKGEAIALTSDNIDQWQKFIAREGHSVRPDARGGILIDRRPASSYTVAQDYIFELGDNRSNSLDGRFWGFIPAENIVGTPMIVYWSWDPNIPLSSLVAKLGSIRFGRLGTIIR